MHINDFHLHQAEIHELMHIENDIAYFDGSAVIFKFLNKRYTTSSIESEEYFRGMFVYFLVNYVGYKKEQIDVQYLIKWGSSNSGYADIVIFTPNVKFDQFISLEGIIELKALYKPEVKSQIESYISASSAWWGIWTDNKNEKFYYKDVMGRIYNDKIKRIPSPELDRNSMILSKGEYDTQYSYIKQKDKSNLVAVKRTELDDIIQKCRDLIWNGHKADSEIQAELNKLITAKLYDESVGTRVDEPYKFQIGTNEKSNEVFNRIQILVYKAIKWYNEENSFADSNLDSYIAPQTGKISISSVQLMKIIAELQKFEISNSDADVRGRIFENVIQEGYRAKGGQFFTPREVVKFCVYMLDVGMQGKILDLACGTGGFLLYSMVYVQNKIRKEYAEQEQVSIFKTFARNKIYGIEKSDELAQIAQTDLRLHGDGSSNITCFDSLRSLVALKDKKVTEEGFRYILTNPPFGKPTRISDLDILNNFDLGRGKSSQDACVLMLERAWELLEYNGYLSIVLPDTVIGRDKDYSDVREFIKTKFKINAIIALPQHTFKISKANVGGYILFLQKSSTKLDYEIFMSIAEHIGYKNNKSDDNELYSPGFEKQLTDYNINMEQVFNNLITNNDVSILSMFNKHKDGQKIVNKNVKIIRKSELKESLECKAYIFENKFTQSNYDLVPLSKMISAEKLPTVLNNPEALVKQVTISRNGEVKLRNNKLVKAKTIDTTDIYQIKSNRIIVSMIDFYQGNVGLVPTELDGAIVTWWFITYMPNQGYTIEYILYLLQHTKMRKYAESLTSGMTGRKYMEENDFLSLQVPDLPMSEQERIIKLVNSEFNNEFNKLDSNMAGYLHSVDALTKNLRIRLIEEFDKALFSKKKNKSTTTS